MRVLRGLGLALAVVVLSGAASAQPARGPLPGVGAEDPRQRVDRRVLPWRALGRVQANGAICTGALIGPRTVLTAAHCLLTRDRRGLVAPGAVHFLLGYHMGQWFAEARVVSFTVGPAFVTDPNSVAAAAADWALLTLDAPLGGPGRQLPLAREAPDARTPLMLAGYQRDRPEVLMADTNCPVVGLAPLPAGGAVLVHGCAGTLGSSGGPLLAPMGEGGWAIVGVASRVARDRAQGMAVPAGAVGR